MGVSLSTPIRIALAVIALLVGAVAFWMLVPRDASFGMFEQQGGPNIARMAFSLVSTIAGVILGSLYRQLRQLQAAGTLIITNFSNFASNLLRSVDLWLGLAGSPIVYALLLQSTNGMSLPGLLLVALENGFCCLLIVNAFVGRTETALAARSPADPPQQQNDG
jgi:hypothetical protein